MQFEELAKKRASTHKFKPTLINQWELATILGAANLAPSAGNLQAYEVYVLQKTPTYKGVHERHSLAMACVKQEWIAKAPLILVFCADPKASAKKYGWRGSSFYCIQDATIACTYAQLMAENIGLAATWVGAFDEREVRRIIKAPKSQLPVAVLAIGHRRSKLAKEKNRRDIKAHTHYLR